MIVYRCEDTIESIFTAIYNSYEERRDHSETELCIGEELRLFAEYVPVTADAEKAEKVARTLRRKFGEQDYERLCFALTTPVDDKAQAVYRTIVRGLQSKCPAGHLLDALADNYVHRAFVLARSAGKEYSHLMGFTRFSELENGIMYAPMKPKNHLMVFLMEHFSDRYPQENFVLHDTGRKIFGFHRSDGEWWQVQGESLDWNWEVTYSAEEIRYQSLFCHFHDSIMIPERENAALQRNLLPLHFREYMPEFGAQADRRNGA